MPSCLLEQKQLWLASYSANDLAYTLVVADPDTIELYQQLHSILIGEQISGFNADKAYDAANSRLHPQARVCSERDIVDG